MKTFIVTLLAGFMLSGLALAGDSTEVKIKTDSIEVKAAKEAVKTEGAADTLEKKTEAEKEPMVQTTKLGVRFQDLVVGEGKECNIGDTVDCHYTLWFADSTGQKLKRFQSSKDRGVIFQTTLGRGLIKGWSDGMSGMKEGGTRRLIIPPELAYGKGDREIPPDQWLVFEIDFLKLVE